MISNVIKFVLFIVAVVMLVFPATGLITYTEAAIAMLTTAVIIGVPFILALLLNKNVTTTPNPRWDSKMEPASASSQVALSLTMAVIVVSTFAYAFDKGMF
jgi:hypothetical protein